MIHEESGLLKTILKAWLGHLLAMFFYDYVIRNSVRIFFYPIEWSFIVGIALGYVFSSVIVWSIVVVHKFKSLKQVTISLGLLCAIFSIKLITGIMGLVNFKGNSGSSEDKTGPCIANQVSFGHF
jgi:hypothetical protein